VYQLGVTLFRDRQTELFMQAALAVQAEPDLPRLQRILLAGLDHWGPSGSEARLFNSQYRRLPPETWQILCQSRGPNRSDFGAWRIGVSDEQNTLHKEKTPFSSE
jgi:hypothetical protein